MAKLTQDFFCVIVEVTPGIIRNRHFQLLRTSPRPKEVGMCP